MNVDCKEQCIIIIMCVQVLTFVYLHSNICIYIMHMCVYYVHDCMYLFSAMYFVTLGVVALHM